MVLTEEQLFLTLEVAEFALEVPLELALFVVDLFVFNGTLSGLADIIAEHNSR